MSISPLDDSKYVAAVLFVGPYTLSCITPVSHGTLASSKSMITVIVFSLPGVGGTVGLGVDVGVGGMGVAVGGMGVDVGEGDGVAVSVEEGDGDRVLVGVFVGLGVGVSVGVWAGSPSQKSRCIHPPSGRVISVDCDAPLYWAFTR